MKFLIVLSALMVCATAKPFLFNHPLLSGLLGGGGSSSSSNAGSSSVSVPAPPPPEPVFVPAPPPPAPEPVPVSSGPSGGSGGLGGLGNLIMIPLNIKKSLLQAHQAKFNRKIQHILGAFSKLGGLGGGAGSSSNSIATGNSISGPEPPLVPVGPPAPVPPPISYPPPVEPAPVSGLSGGNVDYNALGAGESSFSNSGSSSFSSGSGLSSGGNVQTYHPQPAPQTNYHKEPIVLYLYPVDQSSSHSSAGSSSVNVQPAPIAPRPDCNQPAVIQPQPAPFVPEPAPFVPEPLPQPAPFVPEPVAPQQTYGPPDFVPAEPISTSYSSGTASSSSFDYEPQVVQPVPQPQNTYLPPSYKKRRY